MNKRIAEQHLDRLCAAFESEFPRWEPSTTPPELQGVTGEYTYHRCYVLRMDNTHLVTLFSVNTKRDEYVGGVGWSDDGSIRAAEDQVRKRRGHIEWHRQNMPTREFEESHFYRFLGGLAKMGVAKKYPIVGSEVDTAALLADLRWVGFEYLSIMLGRRFGADIDVCVLSRAAG